MLSGPDVLLPSRGFHVGVASAAAIWHVELVRQLLVRAQWFFAQQRNGLPVTCVCALTAALLRGIYGLTAVAANAGGGNGEGGQWGPGAAATSVRALDSSSPGLLGDASGGFGIPLEGLGGRGPKQLFPHPGKAPPPPSIPYTGTVFALVSQMPMLGVWADTRPAWLLVYFWTTAIWP